jgi:hypothetical protein
VVAVVGQVGQPAVTLGLARSEDGCSRSPREAGPARAFDHAVGELWLLFGELDQRFQITRQSVTRCDSEELLDVVSANRVHRRAVEVEARGAGVGRRLRAVVELVLDDAQKDRSSNAFSVARRA